MVDFASRLVQIPSVNPPGEHYVDCVELLAGTLEQMGFETERYDATDRPEHTALHPRPNIVGTRSPTGKRPLVHLNGHFDVVPAGDGWTIDPFAGEVRQGRLYGRGSADMKAGLACAIFAADALRRADLEPLGTIQISGTVDEESGGLAGVAHLARSGVISSEITDHVIIPEPLGVDRICVGHRGVYWFKLTTHGRIAHGSMPFLGVSAITQMAAVLQRLTATVAVDLADRRTQMPVVPEEARRASININSIVGGQREDGLQTPCVADRCEAVIDRRFLVEEGLEQVKAEIGELLRHMEAEDPDLQCSMEDMLVVQPTLTPSDDPLVHSLKRSIRSVVGTEAALIASPGTYDHKHVTQIAGVTSCVAYGPGVLEQAHQPDEWCSVDDMRSAAQVMALTLADLCGCAK